MYGALSQQNDEKLILPTGARTIVGTVWCLFPFHFEQSVRVDSARRDPDLSVQLFAGLTACL